MCDGVDIASFEVYLIDRSTNSCDDIVARKACLEVGVSDHRTDDIAPDFSSLHLERYMDMVIVLTCLHLRDDDTAVCSETGRAVVWPGDRRLACCLGFDRILGFEFVLVSLREVDGGISADDHRRSFVDEDGRIYWIITVDCPIVVIRRNPEQHPDPSEKKYETDEKNTKIHRENLEK